MDRHLIGLHRDQELCFWGNSFLSKYNAYSYDVSRIREHTEWYYQLMDAYAREVPEISMQITYEDMVQDPSPILDEIAKFCGIDRFPKQNLDIGDDRDVSAPYKQLIENALAEVEIP